MTDAPVLTLTREKMRSRALAFAKKWQGDQREEAEAKSFLDDFFEIFGRDRHAVDAFHEYRVAREHQSQGRIDLLWPGKLLVEMKSSKVADLALATEQAFAYIPHLEAEDYPRWVLVSNFSHFLLYDLGEEVHDYIKGMASATATQKRKLFAQFTLSDLPDRLACFGFIRGDESEAFQPQPEVNLKAVKLLGSLHDELKKSGFTGHALESFLVRLLFCLFAEDTDIFLWNSFTRFVEGSKKDGSDLGIRLGKLFQILDTDGKQRSPHLTAEFRDFPYVNGSLFHERLDMPDTNPDHRSALITCCRFDWSRISPGVFGSLFQGVMEPAERRAKGAHYTAEENIMKVIGPLFLDRLKAELASILEESGGTRKKKLQEFHIKLSSLRFLDPACGCGNFLVVVYREIRLLELQVMEALYGKQLALQMEGGDLARVHVDQFYGIEIEEFPARIAETALWLTDHQMNLVFSKVLGKVYKRIPLKKSPTIHHGNALRLDWKELLPPKQCSYIFGNPPFIGGKYMDATQRSDMESVSGAIKSHGLLDYVTTWYVKAAEYIRGSHIRCAFVSTNSISQGEQPGVLWSYLFSQRVKIHFAYRTFIWDNDASGKAHVHVVIIGFGLDTVAEKRLFDTDKRGKVSESADSQPISPYLTFGSSVVITNRTAPLCPVPALGIGNKPIDGGHYLFTPDEKAAFLKKEPAAKPYFRRWIGAEEFINGIERWCLWLGDIDPSVLASLPECKARIQAVRDYRLASTSAPTQKLAKTPTRFHVENFPEKTYLVIPKVSSERRDYIPIAFVKKSIIAGDAVLLIANNPNVYHFGILTSTMHMAWMRTVAGRLKSDYRYSAGLVYNNFPWPTPTDAQKEGIEKAAQAVLDARKPFLEGGSTLAQLYDPLTMPSVLLKAHEALDKAVDKAYRKEPFANERERVEYLFGLYEKLTSPLALSVDSSRRSKKHQ